LRKLKFFRRNDKKVEKALPNTCHIQNCPADTSPIGRKKKRIKRYIKAVS